MRLSERDGSLGAMQGARTLLVLGGTGFLGAHVVSAARLRWRVVAASRAPERLPAAARHPRVELAAWDARAPRALAELLDACRPDVVLDAAALSRGSDCERDPALARELNEELPGRASELCRARGLRFLHVSTDLVFGGAPPRAGRYREDDPPSPLSAYGASKAAGEARVLAADPAALVVRLPLLWGDSFGRGLGASDSLAALLTRGETPRLFVDEHRTPLDVENAARALLELAEGSHAGLLHVAGSERVSRHELAGLLLGGRTERLRPARRADLGLAEQRPADASLDAARARAMLQTPLLGPTRALHVLQVAGRAGGAAHPA
jgi:dTDP-4-dehydrorhamnose reductase